MFKKDKPKAAPEPRMVKTGEFKLTSMGGHFRTTGTPGTNGAVIIQVIHHTHGVSSYHLYTSGSEKLRELANLLVETADHLETYGR